MRIWRAAGEIPPEWYGSDWGALENLVRELMRAAGEGAGVDYGVSGVAAEAVSWVELKQASAVSHQPSAVRYSTMRDFRELKVWHKAHQFTLDVYRITRAFPEG